MRFLALALLIPAALFAACGGGDDDDSAGDSAGANTIDLEKDKGDAFKALERQIKFLADGQSSRAYDELHPSQRKLFTKEQYGKCVEDAAAFDNVKLTLKEAFLEKADAIPGTSEAADSIALTVELKADDFDGQTDTFHEFKVDGKWYFVVADADEVIKGTC